MADETKDFELGDILSITTGRLVSRRLIGGVYDILNWMTNDNLYTHQLPRATEECKPWLLRQHPQLRIVDDSDLTGENCDEWLAARVKQFGETLPVACIPRDDHSYRDPVEELREMAGPDKPIIVVEP